MDPEVLTSNSRVSGSRLLEVFKFKNGREVPLYEVAERSAFNQLIGHAKFANAQYGNVYYRGVNGLYDNVLPSIMRNRKSGDTISLNRLLNRICDDPYFHKSLKLREAPPKIDESTYYLCNEINRKNKYCIEGLLQHYAGNTRFIDVVDNHWIALWMGLHSFVMRGKGSQFCKCEKRELSIGDIYQRLGEHSCFMKAMRPFANIYEYILLMAMPYPESNPQCGIIETADFVEVDLRKVLPSFYLRPHSQHALVIRRRDCVSDGSFLPASYYDMASQVIAILRVRIDKASSWIGEGSLLTTSNLFPSPSEDQGYYNLLLHPELFSYPFGIIKYY